MPCIYLFQDSHDNDSDNEIEDHSQNLFLEIIKKLKVATTVDVTDVEDVKRMQEKLNPQYFAFEKLISKGYQVEPELEKKYQHIKDILISKGYLDEHWLRSPKFFDEPPDVDVGFSTDFFIVR